MISVLLVVVGAGISAFLGAGGVAFAFDATFRSLVQSWSQELKRQLALTGEDVGYVLTSVRTWPRRLRFARVYSSYARHSLDNQTCDLVDEREARRLSRV